jgi:diguanylate cyclase (GGDEF)-like protein
MFSKEELLSILYVLCMSIVLCHEEESTPRTRFFMSARLPERLLLGIRNILPYVAAAVAIGIVTVGFLTIQDLIKTKPGSYAMAGLIVVALLAARWGAGPALLASILLNAIFAFFLFTAYFAFEIEYVAVGTLWVFSSIAALAVSLLVGQLSARNKGLLWEVRQRHHAEARVHHISQHDVLTGLPNRALLEDRINQAIARAQRSPQLVAVLFIDLDHFKRVNDTFGHQIGDRLLQMTASRFRDCLRKGDSVARLGGDEFVLVLPALTGDYDVVKAAQKVLAALQQTFVVQGHDLHVTGSIGISFYPTDGTDAETLLHAADTAMYHAKAKGRGNYQFFTPALNEVAQHRLALADQLRDALDRDEFTLHYQPQVYLQSGRIFAAEALLRWHQSESRLLTCSEFIGTAEETGLILPIGEWALRQACRQLGYWHHAGYSHLRIAVNLSDHQFTQPNFQDMMARILQENRLNASDVELEITESMLVKRGQENMMMLNRLKGIGIQLSLDAFGTGYSSLRFLQRFSIGALKIDRSFVERIGKKADGDATIAAIIAMGLSLNLKVIAAGVETVEQANFLKAHGCLAAQGNYYSEPVPAEGFGALLRSGVVGMTA